MNINLGSSWAKKLDRKISGVKFEVGVIDDKPHMQPVEQGLLDQPQLRSYAGGPIRRTSRKPSGVSTGEVLVQNMERLHTNLLLEPFQKKSSDILKFTDYFLKYIVGRPGFNVKKIENLLQAIVRNPILRKEYGDNTAPTADNKGFDRHLFDTGQMFKEIRARIVRGR